MSQETAPHANALTRFSRGEGGDGCGCIASRFDAVELSHHSSADRLCERSDSLSPALIPSLEICLPLRQLERLFSVHLGETIGG
jgi:hypothetical protein